MAAPRKVTEATLREEIKARGGAIKVRTIKNPNNPNQYMRIYVVRKRGKRGGKTLRGPIQTGTVNTTPTTAK